MITMTLYFIGIGISKNDISLKAIEICKRCSKVYLDSYTNYINNQYINEIKTIIDKEIFFLKRNQIEVNPDFINEAKEKDIALLIPGDPLVATTHVDLRLRCKKNGIKTKIIHGISIYSSISETGLMIYKFGKLASIPYPEPDKGYLPYEFYDVVLENKVKNLHTLLLLDVKAEENRYMRIPEAIKICFDAEKVKNRNLFTSQTPLIGIARLGEEDQLIAYGNKDKLISIEWGGPPHCLIVPSIFHPIEEEYIKNFLR